MPTERYNNYHSTKQVQRDNGQTKVPGHTLVGLMLENLIVIQKLSKPLFLFVQLLLWDLNYPIISHME